MSAPDTNIETQERRHAPSLIGIKGAALFGGLMLLAILFFTFSNTGQEGASAYEGETATTAVSTD